MRVLLASALAAIVITSAGCAGKNKEKPTGPDYRSTTARAPLEVPPGLKRNGSIAGSESSSKEPRTYSAYESQAKVAPSSGASGVLPTFENVRVLRSEDERWLEVKGEPDELWPLVIDFWVKEQIQLVNENPATGVIETDWLENYAEITTVAQRWFRRVFGSFLTAESYDKFRVRLERGRESGTTEIFLSHRGIAADQVPGDNNRDVISTRWVPSESNTEIEAEMLRLLMIHLGLSEEQATQVATAGDTVVPERARLERGENGSRIVVEDDTNVAWRRVGLAIDRIGFTVEDRNRDSGTYFLRSVDVGAAEKAGGENWLGRLLTRNKSVEVKSRVVVAATDVSSQSEVRVLDDTSGESESSESTDAAGRILDLLYEQLK